MLVTGALGQIGTDLVQALRERHGNESVIASDIRESAGHSSVEGGPFVILDVLDTDGISRICQNEGVGTIYHLAALLSAIGERDPDLCRRINIGGTISILEAAKVCNLKVYSPSSIAVFGPTTPRHNTPQHTIMEPNTVYGISKQTGERWNEYYFNKFGVDIRSLRYPGLVGWRAKAGGGTTDYAVNIFHESILKEKYECFLKEDTALPMMYMPDAIRATIELMEAPAEQVKIRSSYNLAGISFTPKQIAEEVSKHIPNFEMTYNTDFRQVIADSWPSSIDDSHAKKDWGWKMKYDLEKMTSDMMKNLKKQYTITA